MTARRLGVAAVMGLALLTPFATASAAGATPVKVPDVQLVVKLGGPSAVHSSSVLGGLPGSTPAGLPGGRWTLHVPEGEVASTLAQLRAAPGVEYATQVRTVHATNVTSPNDACYQPSGCTALDGGGPGSVQVTQSDLRQIGAPAAWAVTNGSSAVTVAVLDTGVDGLNQDLSNVTVGPNLCAGDDALCAGATGPDTDVPPVTGSDESGHGTHVTGTIGATTNNGTGIAGLGINTHVETYKVLDGTGTGSTADLVTGIYDAVNAGARVINMSLGNNACSTDPTNCGPDPDTQAAVQYAEAHNVVVVAAAGNDGVTGDTYPASYPGVLSVASVNANNVTSSFSEFGAAANISAPGEGIVSTWNTGPASYSTLTGTSMATPHVAAAAALVIAANPSLSAAQVTSILRETASPELGNPINGGVLNVGKAVQAAASGGVYEGYRLAGADGSVYSFGSSPALGSLTGMHLNHPVVALADKRDHTGYWMAATDGGVFQFGSAGYYGSTGNVHLNQPIVGMAATPDGGGYWLVASDGGIFDFGDARFYGSTGNVHLNKPVVGMAATPDGGGYWLAASDGGIFQFGDATFHGSTGNVALNRPIVAMEGTSDGGGYWLAASDGGIFDFGDAQFQGSAGATAIPAPVVGIG